MIVASFKCQGCPPQCQGWGLDTPTLENATESRPNAAAVVNHLSRQGCQGGICYYRVACAHTRPHTCAYDNSGFPLDTLDTPFEESENIRLAVSTPHSVCQECQPPTLDRHPPALDTLDASHELRLSNRPETTVNRGVPA